MFIPRTLGPEIKKLMGWFPIVSVTGPRQSGKSTLLRNLYPDIAYVNLETPGVGEFAVADPMGFINDRPCPLIIDEAQRAPALFSALQVISDERGTPGQYILSGSQNFLLAKQISQSLAGRVGITHLLPLSFQEAQAAQPAPSVNDFMVSGGYPRLHNAQIPPATYFESYINTYVERDVTDLLGVRDGPTFRAFLKLTALQAGSLINYSRIANELDVAFQTVKNWIAILESSFVVFKLPPLHRNARKTITKTPKLYFYDTGLLCHLLGIESYEDLVDSGYMGTVVENLVVAETAKKHLHAGKRPRLHFYRDDSKAEIDLIDSTSRSLHAYEIKASQTFNSKYGRHLRKVGDELGIDADKRTIVYRGADETRVLGIVLRSLENYLRTAD